MSTNLLDLSLKKTDRVEFRQPLEVLISDHFSQHASDFDDDIQRLEASRNLLIDLNISAGSLDKLIRYYTQLVYLSIKLPKDLGVEFRWYSASNSSISHAFDDLSYERANVLFNTAAMYACLGVRENRSTGEGLKKAHQQFQQAAGCFTTLNEYLETVSFERTDDLQSNFLSFLIQAMLAQAQECIWQKAVIDHMKDKLIAQLSQQVFLLYELSAKFLQQSTAMSPAWVHHLSLKALHFSAAAQVRMSSAAMASNQYGEEVARLRLASDLCRRAQKHISYVGATVAQDLQGLTAHVESNKLRAEKDNDMIYIIPVPAAENLAPIPPQPMSKAVAVPQVQNPLSSGPSESLLFSGLVPFVVRNVTDIFEQRKDEIVSKEIVNRLHALNMEMQGVLQELGLPASLTVVEQPLGLPPTLKPQAEEVKARGGSKYLEEMLDDVASLALANKELVEQIVDLMDEDSMNATATSQSCESDRLTGFRNQLSQYDAFLTQAQISDDLVRAKLEEWQSRIDLLREDEETLARSIPKGTRLTMSRENESAARKVRFLLNRWELLHSERKSHIENVRNYAELDDIRPDLIRYATTFEENNFGEPIRAEHFEGILARRLSHYASKTSMIAESAATQAKIIDELRTANTSFAMTRSTTKSNSQRERVLQDLDIAYHKYREIINNLEEGTKFYNDFHKALCRVSDEVKAAIVKVHEDRAEEQRLNAATNQLSLNGGHDTIISPPSTIQAGTWHPNHGIAFGTPNKPVTRSSSQVANVTPSQIQNIGEDGSTGESQRPLSRLQDLTFDPSRHTIQYSS